MRAEVRDRVSPNYDRSVLESDPTTQRVDGVSKERFLYMETTTSIMEALDKILTNATFMRTDSVPQAQTRLALIKKQLDLYEKQLESDPHLPTDLKEPILRSKREEIRAMRAQITRIESELAAEANAKAAITRPGTGIHSNLVGYVPTIRGSLVSLESKELPATKERRTIKIDDKPFVVPAQFSADVHRSNLHLNGTRLQGNTPEDNDPIKLTQKLFKTLSSYGLSAQRIEDILYMATQTSSADILAKVINLYSCRFKMSVHDIIPTPIPNSYRIDLVGRNPREMKVVVSISYRVLLDTPDLDPESPSALCDVKLTIFHPSNTNEQAVDATLDLQDLPLGTKGP